MDNPDLLLDIVPINDEDNVLHLLIGVAGRRSRARHPGHAGAEHGRAVGS